MNKKRRDEISIKTIRDALERYKRFRFNVRGTSMFPFLIEGDEVIIERILPEDINIGDIVMYFKNNVMVVHRVVRSYSTIKGRRLFICQGDNLDYEDSPVWQEDIGGKVTKVIRGDIEFIPPSFYPFFIVAVRYLIKSVRRLKSILRLNINQGDIVEYFRRRR